MQQLPVYQLPYFSFGGNAGAMPPAFVLPTAGQQPQQPMVFVAMTPAMAAALGLTHLMANTGTAPLKNDPSPSGGGLPSPSDEVSVVEVEPPSKLSTSRDAEKARTARIIEENRGRWMEEIEKERFQTELQEVAGGSVVQESAPTAQLPPLKEKITPEDLFNCPALLSSSSLSFYESTLSRVMEMMEDDCEEAMDHD